MYAVAVRDELRATSLTSKNVCGFSTAIHYANTKTFRAYFAITQTYAISIRLSRICVYFFLPLMASQFALRAIQCCVPIQWAQYPCYTTVVNHECQALSAHSFAAVSFRMRTGDSGHLICCHCMLPLPMYLLMLSHHQSQDLIPFRQVDALDAQRHFIFFSREIDK